MKEHKVGIIMNGVTGRMGTNQHLLRSIAEIIKQGGVKISSDETIMPDPVLIGRNENKLKKGWGSLSRHTLPGFAICVSLAVFGLNHLTAAAFPDGYSDWLACGTACGLSGAIWRRGKLGACSEVADQAELGTIISCAVVDV